MEQQVISRTLIRLVVAGFRIFPTFTLPVLFRFLGEKNLSPLRWGVSLVINLIAYIQIAFIYQLFHFTALLQGNSSLPSSNSKIEDWLFTLYIMLGIGTYFWEWATTMDREKRAVPGLSKSYGESRLPIGPWQSATAFFVPAALFWVINFHSIATYFALVALSQVAFLGVRIWAKRHEVLTTRDGILLPAQLSSNNPELTRLSLLFEQAGATPEEALELTRKALFKSYQIQ